ncbi:MAG: ABC transporter permease [Deinococcales bacterium]
MFKYIIRRFLLAIPTLIVISFVIFAVLDLAPGDPTGNLPLTIPAEVREQIRKALGADQPFVIKYVKWCQQFFITEPLNLLEESFGIKIGDSENRVRIISWMTRSPVVDIIKDRLPQTVKVVGLAYLLSILIAIPVGVISAYRQYSIFDQVGTFISMIGFSVPTFFTGLLLIIIFSVNLKWFPSIYDTTLKVTDWPSFVQQVKQMIVCPSPLTFLMQPNSAASCARLCSITSTKTMPVPPVLKVLVKAKWSWGMCSEIA